MKSMESLLWIFILFFTAFLFRKNLKENITLAIGTKRLDDKVVIVTGANSGIGFEVALECAYRGAYVVLACRNEENALKAKSKIVSLTKHKNVEYIHLDLASFESIRSFVDVIKNKNLQIDCLINNAGLFWVPYMETKEGFESNFGVNHLGNFLLTILLLPFLSKDYSRIVFVGSLSYMFGKIDFGDINFGARGYDFLTAYADSKLANLLNTRSMAMKMRKERNIHTYCADPGVVATGIGRDSAFMGSFLYARIFKPILEFLLFKSPKEGAVPVLYCVCSDDVEKDSGGFYTGSGREQPWVSGSDEVAAEMLWNVSLEMSQIDLKQFEYFFN